jgi:hypothetical protein
MALVDNPFNYWPISGLLTIFFQKYRRYSISIPAQKVSSIILSISILTIIEVDIDIRYPYFRYGNLLKTRDVNEARGAEAKAEAEARDVEAEAEAKARGVEAKAEAEATGDEAEFEAEFFKAIILLLMWPFRIDVT